MLRKKLLIFSLILSVFTFAAGCGTGSSGSNGQNRSEPVSSEETSSDDSNTSDYETEDSEKESSAEASSAEISVEVSNLTDSETQDQLKTLLTNAGVSEERIRVLFDHIDQFNACCDSDDLITGFKTIAATESNFDEYDLQDKWTAKYPDFNGYDCRITAYGIMAPLVTMADTSDPNTINIFQDIDSLDQDNSVFSDDGNLETFEALFTTVDGEDSDNQENQIALVKTEWEKRGIEIAAASDDPSESRPNLSLITLYLHAHYDDTDNELFVGHAGVLIDCGDDGLYFVEKLAFQAPYRFVKLESREQLKNYLLERYADYSNEGEAPAWVMENGNVM